MGELQPVKTKGSYKHWTKEERTKSAALTTKAEARGWIKPRTKCERCTQGEGILHTHNSNYDVTMRILTEVFNRPRPFITDEEKAAVNAVIEILCWKCHMILHSEYRAPAACAKYWAEIAEGKVFAPVYKHDFSILKRDHNI